MSLLYLVLVLLAAYLMETLLVLLPVWLYIEGGLWWATICTAFGDFLGIL